ncbi:hypothetical protein N825_27670 [Skermanella stibiiresistens SB22]|uniref:Uncharacterized protein n=1 Tax=Skermanella stibiiresistens SB22 TaxID=1385369 RepID=W9HC87_9PROT|nr:papain-like cysteine protease family protein [Skermanella stibiiresistens]EWY41498.1 hypothetical protein N825_27670 [Skermanella stibiiresistens SB22]
MSLFQLQKDVSRARKRIVKRPEPSRTKPSTAQASRTRAFATPVNYRVPGTVPIVRQNSQNVCWAASTTMLMSWLLNEGMTVEQAIGRVGPVWLGKVRNDQPLGGDEKDNFLNVAGMVAKGPANFSLEDWLAMLQAYGPLWVTTSELPAFPFSVHARILVGISGDGTARGTLFHFNDPGKAVEQSETFEAFMTKYERPVKKANEVKPPPLVPPLVVHWAPNAKATVQQQSIQQSMYRDGRAGAFAGAALAEAVAAVGGTLFAAYNSKSAGDIKYSFDKMDDLRCPKKATAQEKAITRAPATATVEEASTCFALKVGAGVRIYWEYNGVCLGPISMEITDPTDYLGGSAEITGSILLNEQPPVKPGAGGKPIIGVRIHFQYIFNCSGFNPEIRTFDVIVYADGTYTRSRTMI